MWENSHFTGEIGATHTNEDAFEVSFGVDATASEGDLTEFRPHVKRARLTRMNEAEVRWPEALAGAIGVPHWEVRAKTPPPQQG